MGTARCKKAVCEDCRILAFLIGKLKAENEDLKAQLANKDEVLAFHNRLKVRIIHNDVFYKEVLCNE